MASLVTGATGAELHGAGGCLQPYLYYTPIRRLVFISDCGSLRTVQAESGG